MSTERKTFVIGGFRAAGAASGVKPSGGMDLALICADEPVPTVGVFTGNDFKAAPVVLTRERLAAGTARAVVVNSGNANAATGEEGHADARAVTAAVAKELGIPEAEVLAASTGIIGHRLPVGRITAKIPELVARLRADGFMEAEEAIMTTDRFPKTSFREVTLGGKTVRIGGLAKGAGMIEPSMATMLSFVMTDAAVEREAMGRVFRHAVDRTFNAVTVDGCMSTNDTALLMASGRAGNRPVRSGTAAYGALRDGLCACLGDLARAMVRDGEGATKVIEIRVEEAATTREAKAVAKAVANANLVKAAFFGGDPNWGRIISAAGSLGLGLPEKAVRLYLEDVLLFAGGRGVGAPEPTLREIMARPEIAVTLRLGMGRRSWRVWASDLTFDYVRINAHYST